MWILRSTARQSTVRLSTADVAPEDVWRVARFSGEPRALEGQPLRWELPDRLLDTGLLEADRPIVDVLLSRR